MFDKSFQGVAALLIKSDSKDKPSGN